MRAVQLVGQLALETRELPTPQPGPGDVLVRIRAVGVCETDLHFYRRGIEAYGAPITLGHELAGEVAEAGANVTGFRVGDRVVVEPCVVCTECRFCRTGRPNLCPTVRHLGLHCDGAFAEYVAVPARNAHRIPDSMTDASGAQVEPYACAVHGIHRVRLQAGEDVLIIGDGYFGSVYSQIARALGARHITVLGHHAVRLARVLQEGADVALDDRSPEVVDRVASLGGGCGPDIVIDTVGSRTSLARAIELAGRGGRVGLFGAADAVAAVGSEAIILKELDILGLASSNIAWEETISLMGANRIHPEHLVSDVFPLSDLALALELKARRAPETLKVVVTV